MIPPEVEGFAHVDSVIDFITGVIILGALVPVSALFRPWGPFKPRWKAGLAAFAGFIVGGMLLQVSPSRPDNIPKAEWDRRIALCKEHAVGQFRDCVRDAAELKRAEEAAKGVAADTAAKTEPKQEPTDPNDKRMADNAKIAEGVLVPYTREDDDDLFKKWGAKGVARIEGLRKAAAYAVAKKDKCDVVSLADITDLGSKPPAHIVIAVKCRNGETYSITQTDIDNNTILSEHDMDEAVASPTFRDECETGIRSMLNFPSTFHTGWLSGGSAFTDKQGNHGLAVPFEAKNGFGNMLPQMGRCTLMPDGKMKVEIRNR